VDVAMIFASLRQHAAFEERERLAREMHDGIAQELVALGYRFDVARREATREAPAFAPTLQEARADLSRVLTDLRLRIADLRLAVRPDQGLGAVVGARLQQFGAATGLTVGLRLSESPYRLPAHLETLIYRLILDVLNDARNAPGITGIEARLDVNAPQACGASATTESHTWLPMPFGTTRWSPSARRSRFNPRPAESLLTSRSTTDGPNTWDTSSPKRWDCSHDYPGLHRG
jgi:hypothetical protein